MQTPTIGSIVHYRLSKTDVSEIRQRLQDVIYARATPIQEGDTFPLVVVRATALDPEGDEHAVSGQVLLDGDISHWARSAREGDGPGTWRWPSAPARGLPGPAMLVNPILDAKPPAYQPPEEQVQAARELLAGATSAELAGARLLWEAHRGYLGGKSSASGAPLPAWDDCKPVPQAAHLAMWRAALAAMRRVDVALSGPAT